MLLRKLASGKDGKPLTRAHKYGEMSVRKLGITAGRLELAARCRTTKALAIRHAVITEPISESVHLRKPLAKTAGRHANFMRTGKQRSAVVVSHS